MIMRYTLLYIITLFLLLSCSGKTEQEERYAEIVSQWQGREIKLPAVMTDFLTGDTINLDDADFTILTYVDSAGCTGCKMKLPLWREFMNSLDTLHGDATVNSVIVVNTKDEEELTHLIKYNAYSFPIVYDKNDSLNHLNVFYNKSRFRTFLLNRINRVIAIGNPTQNSAVADLYRTIISGKRTISNFGTQLIETDFPDHFIGTIRSGEERSVDFLLNNRSCDSVFIRDVITSCNCTRVEIKDSIMLPESNMPIKVFFKEDSAIGEFSRTIHIFYENFDNPTILEISGQVIR